MEVHFIDVGCGNMTLICLPNGVVLLYDCNITADNEEGVLSYVDSVIGESASLSVFVNSHRDADHMRGIKQLHDAHTIKKIWDTGVAGTTTDTTEYREYMELRRAVPAEEIEPRREWTAGDAKITCMNSKWPDYSDSNEQSMVLKIEYGQSSVLLAGDTNYRPWKERILTYYPDSSIKSTILLAAHHGSLTFFDDPSDSAQYYIVHIEKIAPDMTLISVGQNVHGLPDPKAVELYKEYSGGSEQGDKVWTTQSKGTMKLVCQPNGNCQLTASK